MKRALALSMALLATPALAQTALDYRTAEAAMAKTPAGTAAADADLRAAEHQAKAVAHLYRPTVTASASVVAYEKSLSIDLTGPKDQFVGDAQSYLAGLPDQFPPAYADIAAMVAGRIGQALPGLLAPIPDQYDYTQRDVVVRPNITAIMPIYTGGALEAVTDAAKAQVTMAQGGRDLARGASGLRLAEAYFGAQLARQLEVSTRQTLASAERHLGNVRAMEREGVVPHSLTLEAVVARDAAQRANDRARRDADMAELALTRLTGTADPAPSTPLFVNMTPLPPLTAWTGESTRNGQLTVAAGAEQLAAAGERTARATMRPSVYAFGSVNGVRKQSLPVDPDWIVGATVRIPLVSPINRRELVAAAEARSEAARLRAADARTRTEGEIEKTWLITDNARRAFTSMASSVAAAEENLRAKQIGFREGVGTAAEVTDAQTALGLARAQRATAAYEYDLSLAALLAASGQSERFADYAEAPDRQTVNER